MRKILILSAVILMILGCAFYFSFNRIAIYAISKISGLDITYGRITNNALSGCTLTDLRVIYKKAGAGISAKEAKIKPRISSLIFDNLGLEINVKDLFFITGDKKESLNHDNPPNLITMPFKSGQKYENISTTVKVFKDRVSVLAFNAYSGDIRFDFKGDLFYNNNQIFGDMKIYFSSNLLKRLPGPLIKETLADEGASWKSLSVNIKGDYKSPAVQISSKLFRLNIKTVTIQ